MPWLTYAPEALTGSRRASHNHAEMTPCKRECTTVCAGPVMGPALRARASLLVLLAMVLLSAGTGSCSDLGMGDTYPPASEIKPLPKGAIVIFNVTFPPQGTDNDGERVVAIGLPQGVSPATGWVEVLRTLESKGWGSGASKPALGICADKGKGDPCADTMSTTELVQAYTTGGEPSQVRSLLAKLHRYRGRRSWCGSATPERGGPANWAVASLGSKTARSCAVEGRTGWFATGARAVDPRQADHGTDQKPPRPVKNIRCRPEPTSCSGSREWRKGVPATSPLPPFDG